MRRRGLLAGTCVLLLTGLLLAPAQAADDERAGKARVATTTAATTARTTDACGPLLQKPGGGYWSCTFHDEFAGTELDRSKWAPALYSPTTDSMGTCYFDDPRNIAVSDGTLQLTARFNQNYLQCLPGQGLGGSGLSLYSSGAVSTYQRFSQQYGRFEARIKVEGSSSSTQGLHEAFWLYPDIFKVPEGDPWPESGYRNEIDISETYSKYPNLSIPFLHYPEYQAGEPHTAYNCYAPRGQWHTYTLEWSDERIEILVDGRTCLVNTSGHRAFDKPYIIGLTQALGASGNDYLPGVSPPLPATMEIDYVRVWE